MLSFPFTVTLQSLRSDGISYIYTSPKLVQTLTSMIGKCGLFPRLVLNEDSTLLDGNHNPAAPSPTINLLPWSDAMFCRLLTGSTLVHSWQKPKCT